MMNICIAKQTLIGSGNGLAPGQRQAIIWTNAEILLIRTSGRFKFQQNLSNIHTFSFKKMDLKILFTKW